MPVTVFLADLSINEPLAATDWAEITVGIDSVKGIVGSQPEIHFRVFRREDVLLEELKRERPDVLLLSSRPLDGARILHVSELAKQLSRTTFVAIIAPDIPSNTEEQEPNRTDAPDADLSVFGKRETLVRQVVQGLLATSKLARDLGPGPSSLSPEHARSAFVLYQAVQCLDEGVERTARPDGDDGESLYSCQIVFNELDFPQ